jgi:hypothetical protein
VLLCVAVFLTIRSVPASTGCAASTVVPTVALFDNSPMTAARGVVYEFIVTKDLLTSSVNFNFSVSYGNGSLDTASSSITRGAETANRM